MTTSLNTPNMAQTTVSLIDSLLPPTDSNERKNLNTSFRQYKDKTPKSEKDLYSDYTKMGKIFLCIVQQTGNAITEFRYRAFDALARNFGCQLTALEVARILDERSSEYPKLLETAEDVKTVAAGLIKACDDNLQAVQVPTSDTDMATYLRDHLKVDMVLTPAMARLARFRMLAIVNTLDKRDNPHTRPDNLYLLIGNGTDYSPIEKDLGEIVYGVQANESEKAVAFIRDVAKELSPGAIDPQRVTFLNRILGKEYERKSASGLQTPITSLPFLYNTEVAYRSLDSVLLIKNYLGGTCVRRFGAKPISVYVKMPQSRVLCDDEVRTLPPQKPLMVVVGDIEDKQVLIDSIHKIGLIEILQASCVDVPQYASGASTKSSTAFGEDSIDFTKDEEANNDMNAIREGTQNKLGLSAKEITKNVILISHAFCSSVVVERS